MMALGLGDFADEHRSFICRDEKISEDELRSKVDLGPVFFQILAPIANATTQRAHGVTRRSNIFSRPRYSTHLQYTNGILSAVESKL